MYYNIYIYEYVLPSDIKKSRIMSLLKQLTLAEMLFGVQY